MHHRSPRLGGECENTNMTPRIYVASLSDYNNGDLHGRWIDITEGVEHINEQVQQMLTASPMPGAEEWAIHDYELPAGIKISEWESFDRLAAFGEAYSQAETAGNGEAFAAWYGITDDAELADKDATDLDTAFSDAYQGSADTFKDWIVSNEIDVLGIDQLKTFIADAERGHYFGGAKAPFSDMFEKLTYAIDWDMVARDNEGNYTTVRIEGTVYVFTT